MKFGFALVFDGIFYGTHNIKALNFQVYCCDYHGLNDEYRMNNSARYNYSI